METRNKRYKTFDFNSEKRELIKFLENSKLNSKGSSLESPFFQIDGKEKYNVEEMENKSSVFLILDVACFLKQISASSLDIPMPLSIT